MVAALGASGLTGSLGFGGIWWQQHRRDAADASTAKIAAYHQMIASSLAFMMRASALRNTVQSRSGLKEGFDVAVGIREPLDPMALHDWIAKDGAPLYEAWSSVQMSGSHEAVRVATTLLDACGDLIGVATQSGEAHGKIAATFKGVAWTEAQQASYDKAVKRVAKSRLEFIALARSDLGAEAVVFPVELTDQAAEGR